MSREFDEAVLEQARLDQMHLGHQPKAKLTKAQTLGITQANYRKIWTVVNTIPKGKVASYGQVADLAGLPGRARLAGKSLGYIPKDLDVAWYRVLRSNGQLAFAKNSEQALKQTGLLQEEGVAVFNNRVNLNNFLWCPELAELLLLEN